VTFFQALVYFAREAVVNLRRSWKVSLVAILTIAVSLFVGGAFLLLTGNLAEVVEGWRQQMKVVVYLEPGATEEELATVAREVAAAEWVTSVARVSQEEARQRFVRLFPSLSDLLEGWGDEPLPASVEAGFDPRRAGSRAFDAWLDALRQHPVVSMVDDDRDWLAQLGTMVAIARAMGLGLAAVLLAAAVFTIASVVRLTAYLYHDEIAIMRLVGATEFFIRGPFYAEGLLQGTVGALLAGAGLWVAFAVARARVSLGFWAMLLEQGFLSVGQLAVLTLLLAVLTLLGGAAGLFGAVASLRRERLGQGSE